MICFICNTSNLLPIWYGVPGPKEIQLANEDVIILGGVKEKEFTHYCYYCQETFPNPERV
jgi:hypothetical protein